MNESIARLLEWDSHFFGISIAEIMPRRLSYEELRSALQLLWEQGCELVYWASDPLDIDSQNAARGCYGSLVDQKLLLSIETEQMHEVPGKHVTVDEYRSSADSDRRIESIAIACSQYSRFRVDPRISDDKCDNLYRTWIRNSINHSFADLVFAATSGDELSGFVAVSTSSGSGNIGLIGVGESFRGRGIGRQLVASAFAWFKKSGCEKATVVTQHKNISARQLYESTGFVPDRADNFYHFWNPLNDSVQ